MTMKDNGHYARKHPPEMRPGDEILKMLGEACPEGWISCAQAFRKASALGISPREVGIAADFLEIRIRRCQLGLFGYSPEKSVVSPAEQVPPDLESAIKGALVEGRLPCASAWAIARKLGMAKMAVSAACEKLGIKISACQLGAF